MTLPIAFSTSRISSTIRLTSAGSRENSASGPPSARERALQEFVEGQLTARQQRREAEELAKKQKEEEEIERILKEKKEEEDANSFANSFEGGEKSEEAKKAESLKLFADLVR